MTPEDIASDIVAAVLIVGCVAAACLTRLDAPPPHPRSRETIDRFYTSPTTWRRLAAVRTGDGKVTV